MMWWYRNCMGWVGVLLMGSAFFSVLGGCRPVSPQPGRAFYGSLPYAESNDNGLDECEVPPCE